MAAKIQAIRGMHDILPNQSPLWQYVEDRLRKVLEAYGYGEIRMPVVEVTELFKRSIGEVTDIVEKEMYTFVDRNGDSLTLRPEGTAGCVRSCIEQGLIHNQTRRLWYQGPMFRHERPQKGRYRQFHQIGVEAFGFVGPDIDLELILLSRRMWAVLGLEGLELHINSLGTPEERAAYRDRLVAYLKERYDQLDEDSRRRMETNPLRILDTKNPDMQELVEGAPALNDHLGEASRSHFDTLCQGLQDAGIPYRFNPRLVRGLDYYAHTVFEWVTDRLGAQGTVCAGGRYDGLVEQLGGQPTPATGFAMGLERLITLLDDNGVLPDPSPLDAYLVAVGEGLQVRALLLSERLRNEAPDLRLMTHCGGGGFKSQFKKADRSGARYAIVLGEDEWSRGSAGVKPLRLQGEQQEIPIDRLAAFLKR